MPIEFKRKGEEKLTDYGKRQKRDHKRIRNETDSEFWFCVCFKTESDLMEFQKIIGPTDECISGEKFRAMTQVLKPDKIKKAFTKPQERSTNEDLFLDLEYTGWLEADALMELCVLHGALNMPNEETEFKDATDSKWRFTVYFRDREDKNNYLTEWNAEKYGDKYLDGSAWLKSIGK